MSKKKGPSAERRRERRSLGVMAPIDINSIMTAMFENPNAVDLGDGMFVGHPPYGHAAEPERKYVRNEASPKVRRLLSGTENQHVAAQTRGPQTQDQ